MNTIKTEFSPSRRSLPNRRASVTFPCEADGVCYYATVSFFDAGQTQPAEIFLNTRSKLGSAVDTAASDAAVVASIALQYGVPAAVLRDAMKRDDSGAPHGPIGACLDALGCRPR